VRELRRKRGRRHATRVRAWLNDGVSDNVAASVRASCVLCGAVQVPIAAVRLVIARPDIDGDLRNLIEFTCPACGTTCSLRADEQTTRLVAAAGANVVAASVPSAEFPRTRSRRGPDVR
jgi:hypothetical protein